MIYVFVQPIFGILKNHRFAVATWGNGDSTMGSGFHVAGDLIRH